MKLVSHLDEKYIIVKDTNTDAGYHILGKLNQEEYLKHKEILDNVSNNIIPLSVVSTNGSSISTREQYEYERPSANYGTFGYGRKSGIIPQLDIQSSNKERRNSDYKGRNNASSISDRQYRKLEELDTKYDRQLNTRIPKLEILQRYVNEKAELFGYVREQYCRMEEE